MQKGYGEALWVDGVSWAEEEFSRGVGSLR